MKSVRILTLGVKKEFRHGGIFALFTVESFRRAKKYGLVVGEPSLDPRRQREHEQAVARSRRAPVSALAYLRPRDPLVQ
jgi:hypothetical protein